MARLVALNNQAHKALRINPDKVAEQGADLHMIPVVLSEFLNLLVQFPILFSKNAETGQFVCVTLMGLEEGENLFWQHAHFNSIYIPLNIARQPFFVGQDELSKDADVICIDVENYALSDLPEKGAQESLFDEQGGPSHYLQKMQGVLAELIEGEKQTAEFIHVLLAHQLLLPLSLDITFEDGQSSIIKGLYSIDEDKVSALDAGVLMELNKKGYLGAIYTQLASLGQIYALIDKRNKRKAQASPWLTAAGK